MAGSLLAAPLAAGAQQAGKVYRVGHLSGSGRQAIGGWVAAFRKGMAAQGYAEGRSWTFDERYAEGRFERLAVLAQELLSRAPDALLVSTTPANLVAKQATRKVPIVMVLVANPLGSGIVANLRQPEANITGVTNIVAELAGKRVEILREMLSAAVRFAVILNPGDQNTPGQMQSAEQAARALGLVLGPILEVRAPADLERAFKGAAAAKAQAVIRMIDPLVFILRQQTAALAVQYSLPVIYPSREDVEAGGLIAYGTDIGNQFGLAATYVAKILRGAAPRDLPVEEPTKFELVINLKTAKALGLTIPPSLLQRADQVIE
ncbi:MAG TPA: ABC transporter substrate-binding protein [Methylomirabilota bacterium]|nr:ABC transporter substrate-binding protein [Methylomirabilota bacterium]